MIFVRYCVGPHLFDLSPGRPLEGPGHCVDRWIEPGETQPGSLWRRDGAMKSEPKQPFFILLAALLAAGCGGGTDGKPVALTAPAPPPAPAPEPAPAPAPEPAPEPEPEPAPEPEPEPAPEPEPEPEPIPTPEGCTDERERAGAYANAVLPREWDGTPFRFDLFDNFPEVAGGDYPESQLEIVRELAERIEEQIGYPVFEAGAVVPVREGLPDDWDTTSIYGPQDCHLWREPGQIFAFHLPSLPDGLEGGGAVWATPWCGSLSHYVGEDSTTDLNSAWAQSAIVHELFHLFGFNHNDETHPHEVHLGGIFMSTELTDGARQTLPVMAPTNEDIDALRCIFPERR